MNKKNDYLYMIYGKEDCPICGIRAFAHIHRAGTLPKDFERIEPLTKTDTWEKEWDEKLRWFMAGEGSPQDLLSFILSQKAVWQKEERNMKVIFCWIFGHKKWATKEEWFATKLGCCPRCGKKL